MDRTNLDRLDEQLKQLAICAQQHPPLTQGRQLALRQMVNGILQSGRLCRPHRGQFYGVYEEIYDEAFQELLLYICQNIDKYNPERGSVMAWVNVLFERRFFKEAIPRILDKQEVKKMTLSDLDEIASPESTPSLTEIIKQCIELDSENFFKNEHIENHPQANFQALAKRRLLGKSWKEISAEFEIKISTVSRFYDRCLNKYSAKIKEYCTTM
jgi:DNA-directed RNA polymerase specialized sigma24 family protein